MRDPTDLAGNDLQAERDELRSKRRAKQEADDIKWLMANEQGRRIARRLLDQAGVYRTPFASDPQVTAFNCGLQNIGQWFLAQVTTFAPDAYLQMLKATNDDRSDD